MTTFTVNIEDKKAEKAVKAFLDALELNYKVNRSNTEASDDSRALNSKEKKIYKSLKSSLQDIKRWENGEIELRDAKDLLNEL